MGNRRPASVFFTAVLLTVLYFALFPYSLGRELVAKPAWAVDLSAASSNSAAAGQPLTDDTGAAPFQLGGSFGYIRPDGALVHLESTLFRVALSRAGYINYTRVGTDWIMRDPRGGRLLAFSGYGYPLLSEDGQRVLVVDPDMTGVLEVDGNGDMAWSRDFPAILTSLSVEPDFLAAGMLNGSLQLLGRHGTPLFQVSPASGRVATVYGCGVAPDGSYLASVSGTRPQVLTVLGRRGSSYAESLRVPLGTDYRREIRTGFSPDSRYFYYESASAVGLVEPSSGRLSSVALGGNLAGRSFLGNGLAAFASHDGGRVSLHLVRPFVATIDSEGFRAGDLFLGAIGGQLLLGMDSQLLRVEIEEM